MQRAMARQAEAEREKRAKVIHAEGEFQASQQLQEAAAIIAEQPIAIPRSGEPLAIRFVLAADEPVLDPELLVSVHDQIGTLVSEVGTRTRNVRIDQVHGERVVTLELDHLALTEGTYELTAAVRDESGQREYDVRSRFVKFDVLKGVDGDGGLVTLGGSWNL